MKYFLIALVGALALGAAWYIGTEKHIKTAYVVTGKLHDQYKGTKELQQKLDIQENRFKLLLDSIKLEIQICHSKNSKADACNALEQQYKEVYDRLAEFNNTYVRSEEAKIWMQLNTHIETYGREHDYGYVLGANGSGNLMYADSTFDITNEVLKYANQKYDGK